MKNKKILIGLVILCLISALSSFIIYNFNVLKLKPEDRVVKTVDYQTTDDATSTKVDVNYRGYVNRLLISYSSKENLNFTINYKSDNYYGKKSRNTIEESFTNKLNESYTKINNNVGNLNFSIDNETVEIKSIKVDNTIKFNFCLFYLIFIGLFSIFIIYLYFRFNLFDGKIEKLFLSLALLLGSLFIIMQPVSTSISWDDQIHFNNIYKIFDLDRKVEWTESSNSMTQIEPFSNSINTSEERQLQNEYLNKSDKKIIKEDKTSPLISYNELGYIIPGLVLKICCIMGINFVIKIILTKFSMLLFYSIIMYFAIKKLPHGKKIMSVFGLLPSVLFLSTQFSYDPPIIAMICLFVSQYLNIIENKKSKIGSKEALILLSTIIFASCIKAVYIPLILLILFIPNEKFNNKKQRNFLKIGSIVLFVLLMATFVLPTVTESATVGDVRGGNTSVPQQLAIVLNDPIGYIRVLNESFFKKFFDITLGSETIYNYSYLRAKTYNNIYFLSLIVFLFTCFIDSSTNKINKKIKIVNFIIIFGIVLLICTAMYLSFTPIGATYIKGLQRRYFLPLLMPFILIIFANNKILCKIDSKKYDFIIMLIMTLVILLSLYSEYFVRFCA